MDREKVIKGLEYFIKHRICLPHLIPWDEIADAISMLKEQQEEIIQCKDCYYYHKHEYGFTIGDCTYRTAWYPVKENEFCSLAKRKEGR